MRDSCPLFGLQWTRIANAYAVDFDQIQVKNKITLVVN